jgi:hypothetical protein
MARCREVRVIGLHSLKAATGLETQWNFDRLLLCRSRIRNND